jgi:hypothetical protein
MKNGEEYLIRLDAAPAFIPNTGDLVTIFDWNKSGQMPPDYTSFNAIFVQHIYSATMNTHVFQVRASADNTYTQSNFAGSRIRYKNPAAPDTLESRKIDNVTDKLG